MSTDRILTKPSEGLDEEGFQNHMVDFSNRYPTRDSSESSQSFSNQPFGEQWDPRNTFLSHVEHSHRQDARIYFLFFVTSLLIGIFVIYLLIKTFKRILYRREVAVLGDMLLETRDFQSRMYLLTDSKPVRELYQGALLFSDTCSLQSNIPLTNSPLYFEVQLLKLPQNCKASVGVTDISPRPESFSIEAPTGHLYHNSVLISTCPPKINEGDVIGCGIITHPCPNIQFYCNGIPIFPVPFSTSSSLWPIILATKDCHLQYNFGSSEFIYSPTSLVPPNFHIQNDPPPRYKSSYSLSISQGTNS